MSLPKDPNVTALVIELDRHRPVWIGGVGMCSSCGAMWPGTCHMERQWRLECPACNEFTGLVIGLTVFDAQALRDSDYQDRMVESPADAFEPPGDAL